MTKTDTNSEANRKNQGGLKKALAGAVFCLCATAIIWHAWSHFSSQVSAWENTISAEGVVEKREQKKLKLGATYTPFTHIEIRLEDGSACTLTRSSFDPPVDSGLFEVAKLGNESLCLPSGEPKPNTIDLLGQWSFWRWILYGMSFIFSAGLGFLLLFDVLWKEDNG